MKCSPWCSSKTGFVISVSLLTMINPLFLGSENRKVNIILHRNKFCPILALSVQLGRVEFTILNKPCWFTFEYIQYSSTKKTIDCCERIAVWPWLFGNPVSWSFVEIQSSSFRGKGITAWVYQHSRLSWALIYLLKTAAFMSHLICTSILVFYIPN